MIEEKKNNDFYWSGYPTKIEINYDIIKVPKDYVEDWRKKATIVQGNDAISFAKRKLDANLRAQILGEGGADPTQPKISSLKAHFNEGAPLPSGTEIPKLEDNLKGTKHLLVDIPFKNDKNKVQRLKNYIEEIENNVIINDTSWNMMTGSQIRKEKQEFEELYKLELALRSQKEQLGKYSSEVVSSKMYREEISEEKKQSLIEQLENEK